jgi:hypothetical protein
LKTTPLEDPIKVYKVDGTRNKEGTITDSVRVMLEVQGRTMRVDLLVTGLGRNKVILGLPWLEGMNPDIDWRRGVLTWRGSSEHPDGEESEPDDKAEASD